MTRNRFLGPLMLPVLLGASLALLLSPAPEDASYARAATGPRDPQKLREEQRAQDRATQQSALKRIDYQRMEDACAKALDRRRNRLEQAVSTAGTAMTGDAAERVAGLAERLGRVENAIAALDGMVREVGKDVAAAGSHDRKDP